MAHPEVLLENHYGSHQPAVFCEQWQAELEEQALADAAQIILDADHAVSVLYDNSNDPQLDGVDVARLTERAYCAWEKILEHFIPAEGYHLGYLDHDQALFMVPDGWEDDWEDDE